MREAKLENRNSKIGFELETERMFLRPWESQDWIAFRPMATDPEVMRYITGGAPWTDEQVQEFVQRQIRHFAERGFCLWKLRAKEDGSGRIIGFCGLQPILVDEKPEVEIGWWLAKDCWGKGLATEAARAAMQFGVKHAKLSRFVAIARADNSASLHVMRKLGMAFERESKHKDVPVVLHSIRFGKNSDT
jgi:ribosomal-protein-alanine N-acetyltransferase